MIKRLMLAVTVLAVMAGPAVAGKTFESDRSLYERGQFREIPTRELRDMMKSDRDHDRAGRAELQLRERGEATSGATPRDR